MHVSLLNIVSLNARHGSKHSIEETKTDMVLGSEGLVNSSLFPFKLCRELHTSIPPSRETRMIANVSTPGGDMFEGRAPEAALVGSVGTRCGTVVRNTWALGLNFFISDEMKLNLMTSRPFSTPVMVIIITASIIAANTEGTFVTCRAQNWDYCI